MLIEEGKNLDIEKKDDTSTALNILKLNGDEMSVFFIDF